MLEYVLSCFCKGSWSLARAIQGPNLVPGGTLNQDAKIPTRLAFYSLTSIHAAASMSLTGFYRWSLTSCCAESPSHRPCHSFQTCLRLYRHALIGTRWEYTMTGILNFQLQFVLTVGGRSRAARHPERPNYIHSLQNSCQNEISV